jgi:hypothetical protein
MLSDSEESIRRYAAHIHRTRKYFSFILQFDTLSV